MANKEKVLCKDCTWFFPGQTKNHKIAICGHGCEKCNEYVWGNPYFVLEGKYEWCHIKNKDGKCGDFKHAE